MNPIVDRYYILSSDPVLCAETSLAIHGIGTYNTNYPQVYAEVSSRMDLGIGEYVPDTSNKEDIEIINNLKVTSIEKSICDMIMFDSREELILECLSDLIYEEKFQMQKIILKAEQLGILEQLNKYIELVDDEDYW